MSPLCKGRWRVSAGGIVDKTARMTTPQTVAARQPAPLAQGSHVSTRRMGSSTRTTVGTPFRASANSPLPQTTISIRTVSAGLKEPLNLFWKMGTNASHFLSKGRKRRGNSGERWDRSQRSAEGRRERRTRSPAEGRTRASAATYLPGPQSGRRKPTKCVSKP